ncbi:MAG: FGGY-family carbohydrate kinase, partial [Propylenella sp.]
IGGGARSRGWLQIIADALDIAIDIPAAGDFGAAFGAARLGLIAAENADPAEICRAPAIRETLAPVRARVDAMQTRFERYRALYPALREALSP